MSIIITKAERGVGSYNSKHVAMGPHDVVQTMNSLKTHFEEARYVSALYTLATIATIAVLVDYVRMLNLWRKMPPGPFPLPIIGNTFSLPDKKPWMYFEKLSQYYNAPLITFWIGRNPTVWLNDAWCASELLDKRAGIYSSRPHMVVFGDLGSGNDNLVTMKYGERWSSPALYSLWKDELTL